MRGRTDRLQVNVSLLRMKQADFPVLTLVLALWNRVDFRIRQMAPWMSMSQGMMTSNIGALLKDYVAPTSPEILWHSLKNHDFAVAASTAITILITLLIVVSTGLLTLEVHPMRHEQVSYRTRSSFMSDEADTLPLIKSSLPVDILDAIDAISLPYPIGTTPKSVFQLFEPVNHHFSRDVLQEAVVDVVTFDLDCESAQIHVTNWIYSWPQCFDELTDSETPEEYIDMSISTDDCTISPLLEYSYGEAGASGIFAFFDTTSCSDESASTQIFAWLLV